MDDTRINRRAAQSYNDKTCDRNDRGIYRKQEGYNSTEQNKGAKQYHFSVTEFIHNKTSEKSSQSHSYIKQSGKLRSCVRCNISYFRHISTCPVHCCGFCSAVCEKSDQKKRHTFYFQNANEPFLLGGILCYCPIDFPDRKRYKKQYGNTKLNETDQTLAQMPGCVCQGITHNKGAYDCADAPETVQPAHMSGGVVKCDVIVKCGINCSGA